MEAITVWLILLGIMLLCVVIVCVYRCRELKEDWQEKQPPRFREYFWNVVESILEFFS